MSKSPIRPDRDIGRRKPMRAVSPDVIMALVDCSPCKGEDRAATAVEADQFSPTELHVIFLAERCDATREIKPRGRIGRAIEWALGMRFARPLADPRLEALRLFVSLVRFHADRVRSDDVIRLVEAGFSYGQACGLLGYISRRHRSA